MIDITKVTYNKDGLIPAIVQSASTKQVLMLAYMNEEALQKTLETKVAHYYSRSRKTLWKKGETSGHTQQVKEIRLDCDQDTILLLVDQVGVACHTGQPSCFFDEVYSEKPDILHELYQVIQDRKLHPKEGSYTNYLFEKGIDTILKKVGEETSEVIIGAKNNAKDEVIYEVADLVYHTLVLLIEQGVSLEEIKQELETRRPS